MLAMSDKHEQLEGGQPENPIIAFESERELTLALPPIDYTIPLIFHISDFHGNILGALRDRVSEKVEEAEIDKKEVKYLYTNRGEFWFCESKDPSKRFELPEEMIGSGAKFLKPNTIVDAMLFDDRIIGIKFPIKMELKVVEAHEATRGNTAQGATKSVKLETGAEIQVPMFVKEGDVVRVNTETGQYTDRV